MNKSYYFSIASSSSGNSGLFVYNDVKILIDMGVSVRKLSAALKKLDISLDMLDAVLITHEHNDHIKGIATFAKKYSVPVYMTNGTQKEILKKANHAQNIIKTFSGGESFKIKDITVKSFLTPHDANESVGYVLCCDDFSFGYATDMGFVPNGVKQLLSDCDFVVLEANHDVNMLMSGDYPYPLKQRVIGNYGHLSNITCAECVCELAKGKVGTIVLAHLSENNNTPFLAMKTVNQMLYNSGEKCEIFVSPICEMDEPIFFEVEDSKCLASG